jgi:hypothetical protein
MKMNQDCPSQELKLKWEDVRRREIIGVRVKETRGDSEVDN